jgi:hypothetical protein
MKFYPFSKVTSVNLKPLLFVSRFFGVISYMLFFMAFMALIYGVFGDSGGQKDIGGGAMMSTPNYSGFSLILSVWGLFLGVCVLAFSGLCAAIVSIENKPKSNC